MATIPGLTDEETAALRLVLQFTVGGRYQGRAKVLAWMDGDEHALDAAPVLRDRLAEACRVIRAGNEREGN